MSNNPPSPNVWAEKCATCEQQTMFRCVCGEPQCNNCHIRFGNCVSMTNRKPHHASIAAEKPHNNDHEDDGA